MVTLTSRPGTLDPNAAATVRFAPGAAEAALAALAAELGSPRAGQVGDAAARAGLEPDELRAAAAVLRGAGDVVVLWGERAAQGERAGRAVDALLAVAGALGVAERPESGLIEVPAATNARGMREAGVHPHLGPGLADAPERGHAGGRDGRRAGGRRPDGAGAAARRPARPPTPSATTGRPPSRAPAR